MQGLVQAKEKEITTRDELIQQFTRGHIVQVCIRSTGFDMDSERHVVVFCSQHDKFIDILNSLETAFKLWFKKEEPRKDIEVWLYIFVKTITKQQIFLANTRTRTLCLRRLAKTTMAVWNDLF